MEHKDSQINRSYSVDVIIPTYHSDDKLDRLLTMLYKQTVIPDKVIIIHTQAYEGEEQPLPQIEGSNITVVPISRESFDHGGSRKYAASLSDADILMFMTQDAIPADEYVIEKLLEPYRDPLVAASYARQIAASDDNLIERFTRYYNYPKKSRIKSREDIAELGIKTIFCSNVCASYRNSVYKQLGGFVDKTIFNEDMLMAAAMIQADYRIAYVAEAKVIHSHNYSYLQQFARNFDLGVSHRQYAEVFKQFSSEAEGIKLVKKTLNYLIEKKLYHLIPDLIITSGCKFAGYQLGKRYTLLPIKLVKAFSMNKSYWGN
jgi:rhamnosyltransferase